MPNGQVVYFDDDGSRSIGGVWRGCQGPGLRACTLVTHLVILEHYLTHARSTNVSIGVGIGF
jgi:hypothetical protein